MRFDNTARPCALTIAGSDSGGGAGIQTDLKTFHSHGVHGTSAITALTAQNLRGVHGVEVTTREFLRQQIAAVVSEFDVRAIKIGMLANAQLASEVADFLETRRDIPVVLDPVMIATSGDELLTRDAVKVILERLMPLAALITPNVPEAELLLGRSLSNIDELIQGGEELVRLGAQAVLLKGGHLPQGDNVTDVLVTASGYHRYTHDRLPIEAHGTGCTLSSAIAANLVHGKSLEEAVSNGIAFVNKALLESYRLSDSEVRILNA